MMKLVTSFLLASSIAIAGIAQNTDQKDPKAKVILDKLVATGKTYKTVQASFSYNLKNKDAGIDETQEGNIWIKGDAYKLELNGLERISDGKTIWTYLPDDGEVQIAEAGGDEDSEEMMKPSELFTMYEKGFNYQYEKQVQEAGKTLDVIKLFPEKGGKPYHTIKLYVPKGKSTPHHIEIYGKDGNLYTYTIKELKANPTLASTFFTFDESKAEDVIDLR